MSDILRMEAAAEYLLQRHKAKELGCPFHQATLKQLEIIMGRDAEATPQTPIAEDAMQCDAMRMQCNALKISNHHVLN